MKAIAKYMLDYVLIAFIGFCAYLVLSGYAQAAETAVTTPVTLQDSLVSIINQVQSGVSAGVSFLQAEIPDVIRQLLTWKLVEAGFWIVLQTIIGIIGIHLITCGIRAIHKNFQLETAKKLAESIVDRASYCVEDRKEAYTAYNAAKLECEGFTSTLITRCIAGVAGILCFIIFVCNVVGNALTVLKIWIAPKVWLIEYAASLVK